jgi:hypothetical protein
MAKYLLGRGVRHVCWLVPSPRPIHEGLIGRHVLRWMVGNSRSVRPLSANPRSEQMTTAGPSDYRSSAGELGAHADGIMDEVSDRASTLTSDVVRLAFAIGALWVVKRQQQQSSLERLRSQLPSFSDAGDWLPRRWRSNAGIDWAKLRPSRWA